jgi:RHS repeat-associated protein
MPSDWNSISYVYDPGGRRIEKKYDGQAVMKYFYDGDSIIAEYDATGALVHKYIYGPGVDQPICMIDASDTNATYYYHFDGLGSVIALTDSAGAVANLYEYSIFGEVSAGDPNHPNRFLFTGREFDSETGLYYYRARYYNPYIGRFLQTDPVGYGDGMNWYAYCYNNAVNSVDPLGLRAEPRFYGYYRDIAKDRNRRNTDSNRYGYYSQNARFNCAPTALANLYIAMGERAVNHVYLEMRDRYPDLVPTATGRQRANYMVSYFEDCLEVEMGKVNWANNDPLNMWLDRKKPIDYDWQAAGIRNLRDVYEVIKDVAFGASYHWIDDLKGRLPITAAINPPELGGKGTPVIVAFRTSDATPNWGVCHHVVVVRYCEGAESCVNGKWVSTPYEIIDGQVDNYQQFYLTSQEFMDLAYDAGAEAVVPY